MFSRRKFLVNIGAMSALSFTANFKVKAALPNSNIKDKLGLHLACVENELMRNPQETLEFIQRVGIKHLELPSPHLLIKLNPILKGMGFQVHASHFPSPYISGNWNPYTAFGNTKPTGIDDFESLIQQVEPYHLSYLVFPNIFPEDRGDLRWFEKFALNLNTYGKVCQDQGIQLCYRNHSFEFQPTENSSPMEVMLQTLKPELVKFELDVFWTTIAGIDVEEFILENHALIALLLLGDVSTHAPQIYRSITLPADSYKEIGAGKVSFPSILNSELTKNILYYFINLQQSDNVLEDIQKSVTYLTSL